MYYYFSDCKNYNADIADMSNLLQRLVFAFLFIKNCNIGAIAIVSTMLELYIFAFPFVKNWNIKATIPATGIPVIIAFLSYIS